MKQNNKKLEKENKALKKYTNFITIASLLLFVLFLVMFYYAVYYETLYYNTINAIKTSNTTIVATNVYNGTQTTFHNTFCIINKPEMNKNTMMCYGKI